MRHRERRRANVLRKKPSQMTTGHAESICQVLDPAIVQCAVGNQSQSTPYRCGGTAPGRGSRCTFRTASQAWAKPCLARCRGARVKLDVFALRRDCRTNRAAIDTGGDDPDVELTVKPGVSGQPGAFVNFVLLLHAASIRRGSVGTSQNRTCMKTGLAIARWAGSLLFRIGARPAGDC